MYIKSFYKIIIIYLQFSNKIVTSFFFARMQNIEILKEY